MGDRREVKGGDGEGGGDEREGDRDGVPFSREDGVPENPGRDRATPKISQPPLPGPWAAAYQQLSPQLLESSSLTEAPAPASVYFWSHS